jgi:hypothetical protein
MEHRLKRLCRIIAIFLLPLLVACGYDDKGNQAPVAVEQSVATNEDTPLAVTLTGEDEDGTITDFTIEGGPAHGSLSGTAPDLTYTPDADYYGSDSFTFTVTDNDDATSGVATVSVTVNPVNDLPAAIAHSITTYRNAASGITLSGSDGDGTIGTYTIESGPGHGSLSGTTPDLTYMPDVGYVGSDGFTFTVTDNEGAVSSAATVSITVVNHAPVATEQSLVTDEDLALAVALSGSDGDGTIGAYAIESGPGHGSLSGTSPGLTYTPDADYFGSDSFTFTVTDNDGATSSAATVLIAVTAINDAPNADADALTATGNTQKTFGAPGVLANDGDVDTPASALTVTSGNIATVNGGTVNMNSDGSFTYTPPAGFSSDTFSYTLNDNDASDPKSSTGTATITMADMVWYVDDAAAGGGSGTSIAPFNTLSNAVTAAGSSETIFLYAGSYTGGITLPTAAQLIGEGEGLDVDGLTVPAGTAPTISAAPGTDVITLSNGNTLMGIAINGGQYGIRGSGIDGLTVQNVRLSNTGGDSISLFEAGGTVSLLDSTISNDTFAVDGLDIDNVSLAAGTLTLTVNNAIFSGDATVSGMQNAIDVVTSTGGILDATITGSSLTDTWADGIEIDINGTAGGDSVTIGDSANRNTFIGVGEDVMDLSAQNNASVSFDIRGNDADGSGLSVSDGIDILIGDGATITLGIIDNTLTDIGGAAADKTVKIAVGNASTANSRTDITVSNNLITNNTATGLLIDVFGDSDANVTVNDNTFGNNGNNAGLTVITTTANTQACLAATGNSFGTDQITLTESADGSVLRVPGVYGAAMVSMNNGGVTVNTSGSVVYGEACTIP